MIWCVHLGAHLGVHLGAHLGAHERVEHRGVQALELEKRRLLEQREPQSLLWCGHSYGVKERELAHREALEVPWKAPLHAWKEARVERETCTCTQTSSNG